MKNAVYTTPVIFGFMKFGSSPVLAGYRQRGNDGAFKLPRRTYPGPVGNRTTVKKANKGILGEPTPYSRGEFRRWRSAQRHALHQFLAAA